MTWTLKYDAPKGGRVNRYFWAVTTFDGPCYLWWCEGIKKWVEKAPKGMSSSTHCHGPKTTKAFLRYLNKHPELKGHTVVFVNNYSTHCGKGLSIEAVWEE